jgi:hypothetical protein
MTNLLLAVIGVAFLAQSGSAPVSGTWQVEGTFDEASRSRGMAQDSALICVFNQTGETLSGTCGGDESSGVVVSGTVRGAHVVWSFEIALTKDGPKHLATFDGRLNEQDARLDGTFSIRDVGGTFAARKQ